MRTITTIRANDDWTLDVAFNDGAERRFDVKPLLTCEAFEPLRNLKAFKAISNGGYFVEWDNEADLSADTLYLEGNIQRTGISFMLKCSRSTRRKPD